MYMYVPSWVLVVHFQYGRARGGKMVDRRWGERDVGEEGEEGQDTILG